MVFKPFSHLARQSFTKSITHGYAQSVVAATQSSYASTTTQFTPFGHHTVNRYGKPGTPQLRDAFQNASASSNTNTRSSAAGSSTDANSEGGLDAYYAAWQRQQRASDAAEWQQFQFPKRIGWKPPTAVFETKGKEEEDVIQRSEVDRGRDGQDSVHAYGAGAVDELQTLEGAVTGASAVVEVDPVNAKQIDDSQKASTDPSAISTVPAIASQELDVDEAKSQTAVNSSSELSSVTARSSSPAVSQASDKTTFTASSGTDAQPYVEHLGELHKANRYAEIPPVFESMLRAGILPSAAAYNALLAAAIHLPTEKHQVIPKALDVYADMLRRRVVPSTEVYTTLIDLLSFRALEVSRLQNALKVDRLRFGGLKETGRFMFRSQEAECDILVEDDALDIAIKLFESSTTISKAHVYAASTYRLLLNACAAHREVDHMIRIYSHMEAHKVVPFASIYPSMIKAFAVSGDLRSAVECYNEYKSLAIADDNGKLAVIQRTDDDVYAAVVKAYSICGKHDGAARFFGKIVDQLEQASVPQERLYALRDTVIVDALVQARLDSGAFAEALRIAEEGDISAVKRNEAMIRICTMAADHNDIDIARRAYRHIISTMVDSTTTALAMLALHVRHADVEAARIIWATTSAIPSPTNAFIGPTAMYSVALIGSGSVDEGLMQARQSFARIRSSPSSAGTPSETTEQIDEAIEFIGSFLAEKHVVPSAQASMSFLWAMVENGGLVTPVAEQLLAGLGPADVAMLSWQDLKLALQIEAGIVGNEQATLDVAHSARFAHLLETSLKSNMPLDQRTSILVEKCLAKVGVQRPDLVAQWHAFKMPAVQPVSLTSQKNPAVTASSYANAFDPYANMVDHRGSAIIIEELEKQGARGGTSLNEALARFKNIRRAGRHPRYIAYAKLISAAAKEGRTNLMNEILGTARQDVPLEARYPAVVHGWTSILDAMVGACLTIGNRRMAATFHRELLDLGAAPSANTFGLYITTLKESTKTFDEATEAVKIFHQAKSEGVEPSSFLYNALIGKLGKARRIDDCLFYFAEMRTRGIRPTSVTYGTIVNALCRVSDERFAQELFDEMESMPNYKPRPAPYNSLMQFFLTTKRDSSKVLEYYRRMHERNIQPTMHTYKLLIDTYATLEPIDMAAAEGVLDTVRASGQHPEAVHYASLIHAKGCALHDLAGARHIFDGVLANSRVRPQACLFQAMFEAMVANHCVKETGSILKQMGNVGVEMTPYIANTLIHGWAMEKDITEAKAVYDGVGKEKREPSTYEAMTRAFLAVEDRDGASQVVHEMLSRGYPSAVSGKILELLGHGMARASSVVPSTMTPSLTMTPTSVTTPELSL